MDWLVSGWGMFTAGSLLSAPACYAWWLHRKLKVTEKDWFRMRVKLRNVERENLELIRRIKLYEEGF